MALVLGIPHLTFRRGDFRNAARWMERSKWLVGDLFRFQRPHVFEYLGLTRMALRSSAILSLKHPAHVNALLNLRINAGRYTEALEAAAASLRGPVDSATAALIRVNAAEALYNLGRWDQAWQVLEGIDAECDPLALAGLINQRCWIMAHTGRAAEASTLHPTAVRDALPVVFFAEHHFTGALVALQLGQFETAIQQAMLGQALAKRASSKRNALFLLARIRAAQGDLATAESLFREGSHHRYQAQGGDGLLGWGDCLARLGRPTDAKTAWQLCLKRDPQSAAAAEAARRLGSGEVVG